MPDEKTPSSGAFLPASLMYFCSGQPMRGLALSFCSNAHHTTLYRSSLEWFETRS